MGLFFPMEGERYENDSRRRGFARYRQVLERDWKQLILIDLAALATFLPAIFGISLAVMNRSVPLLLISGVVGGAIASVGITAMYDFILRRLRDDLAWCMLTFKKSTRQNFKAGLLPGTVEGVYIGFLVFSAYIMYRSGTLTFIEIGIFALASILFTIIYRIWWIQVVLFTQKHLIMLKNCLFFIIKYPKKILISALIEVLWWAAGALLLPYSAFLVPFLGIWYILLAGIMTVYTPLNAAFRIEEQISAKNAETTPKGEEIAPKSEEN